MVVCKCHKATSLYCFVHKVPVCGECICASEHNICVVRTYAEWVIDGDYDWPPECNSCHETLQAGDSPVSRLGCLHVFHNACLMKHLQSFPPHTAPAGYTCTVCSAPIWPPKLIKDFSCALALQIKERISQSGLSKNLLGNEGLGLQQSTSSSAVASAPLASFTASSQMGVQESDPNNSQSEILLSRESHYTSTGVDEDLVIPGEKTHIALNMDAVSKLVSPTNVHAGALTRKASSRPEKTGSNYNEYDAEDEDEVKRKYNHRGPLQKQALKYLMPFTSNPASLLPVTTPSRKDEQASSYAEDIIEGRHRRRSRASGFNTKRVLLVLAIMSCMATMLLLYYRLLQGASSEDISEIDSNQALQ